MSAPFKMSLLTCVNIKGSKFELEDPMMFENDVWYVVLETEGFLIEQLPELALGPHIKTAETIIAKIRELQSWLIELSMTDLEQRIVENLYDRLTDYLHTHFCVCDCGHAFTHLTLSGCVHNCSI